MTLRDALKQRKLFAVFMGLLSTFAVAESAPTSPDKPYPESAPFYQGSFAVPVSEIPAQLKVVSYNVGFLPHVGRIIDDFLETEEISNADIILLQEVTGPIGGQGSAIEIMARALQLNYVFSPGMVFDGADYGNAILSRYPIKNFRKVILPYSDFEFSIPPVTRTRLFGDSGVNFGFHGQGSPAQKTT